MTGSSVKLVDAKLEKYGENCWENRGSRQVFWKRARQFLLEHCWLLSKDYKIIHQNQYRLQQLICQVHETNSVTLNEI